MSEYQIIRTVARELPRYVQTGYQDQEPGWQARSDDGAAAKRMEYQRSVIQPILRPGKRPQTTHENRPRRAASQRHGSRRRPLRQDDIPADYKLRVTHGMTRGDAERIVNLASKMLRSGAFNRKSDTRLADSGPPSGDAPGPQYGSQSRNIQQYETVDGGEFTDAVRYLPHPPPLPKAAGTSRLTARRSSIDVETQTDSQAASSEADNIVEYRLTTTTGDRTGAGTTAQVTVVLLGDKGRSPVVNLNSATGSDAGRRAGATAGLFSRKSVHSFLLSMPRVGRVTGVEIGHDGVEHGSDWFLESVVVDDLQDGRRYYFPCSRWLSVRAQDKMTRCSLTPAEVFNFDPGNGGANAEVKMFPKDPAVKAEQPVWPEPAKPVASSAEKPRTAESPANTTSVSPRCSPDLFSPPPIKPSFLRTNSLTPVSDESEASELSSRSSTSERSSEPDTPRIDLSTSPAAVGVTKEFKVPLPEKSADRHRLDFLQHESSTAEKSSWAPTAGVVTKTSEPVKSPPASEQWSSLSSSTVALSDAGGNATLPVIADNRIELRSTDNKQATPETPQLEVAFPNVEQEERVNSVDESEEEKIDLSSSKLSPTPTISQDQFVTRIRLDIQRAIQNDSLSQLKSLAKSGIDLTGPATESHLTPLHMAAKRGNLDMVEWLVLDQEANMVATDAFGKTPLDIAEENRQWAVANFFRKQLGQSPIQSEGNEAGLPPQNLQSMYEGASDDSSDSDTEDIEQQSTEGSVERFEAHLKTDVGKQKQVESTTSEGHVMLDDASKAAESAESKQLHIGTGLAGDVQEVQPSKSATSNRHSPSPQTEEEFREFLRGKSIQQAVVDGDVDRLMEIIRYNPADVRVADNRGYEPLHIACELGRDSLLIPLYRAGAPLDLETATGYSPVHLAAMTGHLKCLQVLGELGANLDEPTIDLLTPLHLAAKNGHLKVVDWLVLTKESNMSAQDMSSRTPLDIAEEYDQQLVVALLRYHLGLGPAPELDDDQQEPDANVTNTDRENVASRRKSTELEERMQLYDRLQQDMRTNNTTFLDAMRREAGQNEEDEPF